MYTVDLSSLYKNSIGFDRMANLMDTAMNSNNASSGYPPYNIEVVEDNTYAITLAVAGFEESDLTINVENGVLTVRGEKTKDAPKNFLHQGIANRAFERKFNLADHIEVTNAQLKNGMLSVSLLKEIPEAMKPRSIAINSENSAPNYKSQQHTSSNDSNAA